MKTAVLSPYLEFARGLQLTVLVAKSPALLATLTQKQHNE